MGEKKAKARQFYLWAKGPTERRVRRCVWKSVGIVELLISDNDTDKLHVFFLAWLSLENELFIFLETKNP